MNTTSIRSLARAPLASRPLAVLLAAAVLCATAPGAGASQPKDVPLTSAEALAALDSLAGKWVGTTDHGDPITIEFSTMVKGTILVETQSPRTAEEMVSVYSRAGDDLTMIHYCPIGPRGNQPHMQLDRTHSTPALLRFSFTSLTNLDPERDLYVHDGVIRILDANHIERDWNIYDHGHQVTTEHFRLTRQTPSGSASAEDPAVEVGGPAVDGSFLRPYDNVWRFSIETTTDGVDHFQGLWTDHLQKITRDGKVLWLRAQGMTYVDGRTTSVVNVFDPATLAPVSSESRNPDGSFLHRDFRGRHVSFRRIATLGAKEATGEFDLPKPVFDFAGGMWGLLLASFPLHPGYRATFSAIDEFKDTMVDVSLNVRGREMVDAGSRGKVEAWVAEVGPYTFWLTKEAPYVIRLTFVGARKNIAKWEIL